MTTPNGAAAARQAASGYALRALPRNRSKTYTTSRDINHSGILVRVATASGRPADPSDGQFNNMDNTHDHGSFRHKQPH